MILNKLTLSMAAGAAVIAMAPVANAATVIPIGSSKFFITNGTVTSPSITAQFSDSFSKSTVFDDMFTFTIPQNGMGSGSISTSFSSIRNKLTISEVLINGQAVSIFSTGAGQAGTIGGVPIVAGMLNTIQVKGFTRGAGGFTGTATFTAAVPEPATWVMLIAGFGLVGAAMRRRSINVSYA